MNDDNGVEGEGGLAAKDEQLPCCKIQKNTTLMRATVLGYVNACLRSIILAKKNLRSLA